MIEEIIDSKNELEGTIYQTKSVMDNEKIKDKLSEEDIQTLNDIIDENETWLNDNDSMDDAQPYKDKMNEFNTTVQPIMSKLYPKDGEGDTASQDGMPEGNSGPTLDEVD